MRRGCDGGGGVPLLVAARVARVPFVGGRAAWVIILRLALGQTTGLLVGPVPVTTGGRASLRGTKMLELGSAEATEDSKNIRCGALGVGGPSRETAALEGEPELVRATAGTGARARLGGRSCGRRDDGEDSENTRNDSHRERECGGKERQKDKG